MLFIATMLLMDGVDELQSAAEKIHCDGDDRQLAEKFGSISDYHRPSQNVEDFQL